MCPNTNFWVAKDEMSMKEGTYGSPELAKFRLLPQWPL